jgi:UDP-2,3-diacylglucosamine pyrophosphatase LpxH
MESMRILAPGPWTLPCLAAGAALAALLLEAAVRGLVRTLPTYRRHLALFLLLSLAGAARGPLGFLAAAAGAVLGLGISCLPLLFLRWTRGLSWRRGTPRRPDPDRPLVIVADPHWSGELTGLRKATEALPGADWLFLGDTFDVWVGLPGMGTPLQADFLEWVDGRRREGRWVGFWMGNREYFLDGLSRHFDYMGEGIGGGLPGEGLAFEHGDLVNARDGAYRVWNLVSRSGVVWALARILPAGRARALADALERKLRTTNRAYKLTFPREAFRAAAQAQGDATFLTGHFHTFEQEGNGFALPWAHDGNFMVWTGRQIQPFPPTPGP